MKPATHQRLTKRTLRELRGPYSQREAANAVGIKPEGYQQWELGTTQPSPESLRMLLDHYITWKKRYGQDPTPLVNRVLTMLFPDLPEPQPTEGEPPCHTHESPTQQG